MKLTKSFTMNLCWCIHLKIDSIFKNMSPVALFAKLFVDTLLYDDIINRHEQDMIWEMIIVYICFVKSFKNDFDDHHHRHVTLKSYRQKISWKKVSIFNRLELSKKHREEKCCSNVTKSQIAYVRDHVSESGEHSIASSWVEFKQMKIFDVFHSLWRTNHIAELIITFFSALFFSPLSLHFHSLFSHGCHTRWRDKWRALGVASFKRLIVVASYNCIKKTAVFKWQMKYHTRRAVRVPTKLKNFHAEMKLAVLFNLF